MYISATQSNALDKSVKAFEVALRSFIADNVFNRFPTSSQLSLALSKIAMPPGIVHSRRFESKIRAMVRDVVKIHSTMMACKNSISTKDFNNDVPYVSELIDFLLIFFNDVFSHANITREFSTVEEFHYCCSVFHQIRNSLSHPASRPIVDSDAVKVLYFIENLTKCIEDKYFWYIGKSEVQRYVSDFDTSTTKNELKAQNLDFSGPSYKQLLCRDAELGKLYSAIIGTGTVQRLAGSVVLYGYGGVGKTALTTDFLFRLIKDKKDGLHPDLEFLLFYSSKDEYLRSSTVSGELYIDVVRPHFSSLAELIDLINTNLGIKDISEISKFQRGIVVIDNLENIPSVEKDNVIAFIKSLPRSVQFIVTSRSEELCEEKIHIEEFKEDELGIRFINEIIESEGFNILLTPAMAKKVLSVSKGNALIILQILNNLSRGLTTFEEITSSLETLRSKNSEIIANFMYKNTFDDALRDLKEKGYPADKVIQIISLYDERIELYSISRLAEIEISAAESLCNLLLERLVLIKFGEYYELNEFAKRFVFIKLLPGRVDLDRIKEKIKTHKARVTEKLGALELAVKESGALNKIVSEWQPRNYIDKIVMAELFDLYRSAEKKARQGNEVEYRRFVIDFDDHTFITNHPYVAFQKARLQKLELFHFKKGDPVVLQQVERSYEEAIESIEFDYRYLLKTPAHSSLLMLFGVFLTAEKNEHDRAIRYLEDAKIELDKSIDKTWFICCNYLVSAYAKLHEAENYVVYEAQARLICAQVLSNSMHARSCDFNIARFKKEFSTFILR
jgi:hypothetical protein